MEFLACTGTITAGALGEPLCSGSWVAVTSPTFQLAELASADLAQLIGAGLVVMIIAFSFKVLRKQMGF